MGNEEIFMCMYVVVDVFLLVYHYRLTPAYFIK